MAGKSAADLRSNYWLYKILPQKSLAYAQLARLDRPIGWQLLFWPCLWGSLLALLSFSKGKEAVSLAHIAQADFLPVAVGFYHNFSIVGYFLFTSLLFLIGAIVMRGAGCTYNDIVDYKIDAKVARTATRPIPSGRVSRNRAKIFMIMQCLIGLVVLLQLPKFTILLGFCSLFIVALYPFMKRISNWPQAVLGLCFNWGVLVGFAAFANGLSFPAILLYLGAVCWTIGYDTIYAHQDREDDALIGAYSTARLFGEKSRLAIAIFYSLTALALLMSFCLVGAGFWSFVGLSLAIIALIWQLLRFDMHNAKICLALFKFNNWLGLVVVVFTLFDLLG